ncbi:MAG: ParB/RepB/Spo0J family partition protein [Phenylobacterium sp.]|jgi:ParB/RepB/Spo0J family partition protein
MARKTMLGASEVSSVDIDDLLNQGDNITLDSPCTPGRMIEFELRRFEGEAIIEQTSVYSENKRNQQFLTQHSLAPLIDSIKISNQVTPAIARKTADGISVIYGSCRRLATYYAKKAFIVLVSNDITDDEAKAITQAENISSHISLIERGYGWLKHQEEGGLTLRQIATDIEGGKVSHTLVGIGINGAKIDAGLLMLYPSINVIGKPTIIKLNKALQADTAITADEIVAAIKDEDQHIIDRLRADYKLDQDINCTELTNLIVSYCQQPKEKQPATIEAAQGWSKHVNVKTNTKGAVTQIKFTKALPTEAVARLQTFVNELYEA